MAAAPAPGAYGAGMPYPSTFTGTVRLDPPLGPEERVWVAALRAAGSARARSCPGRPSPWAATRDGHLRIDPRAGDHRQVPEWLAWIAAELRAGGLPRTLRGLVRVRGAVAGDRWELHAGPGALTVARAGLPCPPCWRAVQLQVAPSVAYAFAHAPGLSSRLACWLSGGAPDAEPPAGTHAPGPPCVTAAWPRNPTLQVVRWPLALAPWWHRNVPPPSDRERQRA